MIMQSNDREHLGMLMQSHRWELIAAARRQVRISRDDADDVVQQLCLDVLEGRHPPFDDQQQMLTWLRMEVVDRCMQKQHAPGDVPAVNLPVAAPSSDEVIRRAFRGSARAIRQLFLLFTHMGLVDIERQALQGCPGWREGSALEELHQGLRRRTLPEPPADVDAEEWLVVVMVDLAERRASRLAKRVARGGCRRAA
jgi:DNA-directed RNA polymerase specialized sigma24 family protein